MSSDTSSTSESVTGSDEPPHVDLEFSHDNNKFQRLRQKWEAETEFLSSTHEIAMNESYQSIIGMGEKALPFILKEMTSKPSHWFWALRAITEDNPVPPEHRGKIKEMTNDWLMWGRKRGYAI